MKTLLKKYLGSRKAQVLSLDITHKGRYSIITAEVRVPLIVAPPPDMPKFKKSGDLSAQIRIALNGARVRFYRDARKKGIRFKCMSAPPKALLAQLKKAGVEVKPYVATNPHFYAHTIIFIPNALIGRIVPKKSSK